MLDDLSVDGVGEVLHPGIPSGHREGSYNFLCMCTCPLYIPPLGLKFESNLVFSRADGSSCDRNANVCYNAKLILMLKGTTYMQILIFVPSQTIPCANIQCFIVTL